MAQADRDYYVRRADQERTLANRAATLEAKAVHQQLQDLYLVQADAPSTRLDAATDAAARG